MRISVINCVSTALKMLRFSTDAIFKNAGTKDFDYIVVTWCLSDEVRAYLNERTDIIQVPHMTIEEVGYVPNLRAMVNDGFNKGYEINDYCALVNTDMYFGRNWLVNLIRHASEDTIVNSVHITPIRGPNVITFDLGIPTYKTFNIEKFERLYRSYYRDILETEEERGCWRATNTMPYIMHRKWWEMCGPWELQMSDGDRDPPDRRFFKRCHNAGARHTMNWSSIVYHHEAVERRQMKPKELVNMPNER